MRGAEFSASAWTRLLPAGALAIGEFWNHKTVVDDGDPMGVAGE
jgi:hypothetical protein